MRESFIMYKSFFEPIKDLSNEDKGILFDAICNLALYCINPVNLSPVLQMAFNFISSTIDRDQVKYQNITDRNRNNIGKRWNKDNTKNTTGKTGKIWDSDNDNDNDNENKKEKKKTCVFVRPSLIEIEECFASKIKEEGKRLDPTQQAKQFEAHYESIGWMVGKNKMKNWKSAISGWVNRTTGNIVPVKQQINGYKTEKAL